MVDCDVASMIIRAILPPSAPVTIISLAKKGETDELLL